MNCPRSTERSLVSDDTRLPGLHAPARVAVTAALAATLLALATSTASAQHADHSRIRFGISGVGGAFVGAVHGGLGGISPRIGVQVNDLFAVYVQGQGLVGQFFPTPDDRIAGFAFHALMFELTLADSFQLGLGPSLDFVWGCNAAHQGACTGGGPYLGGDARIAFLVGGHEPRRRSALAFSLDVHPTWFGNDASIALLFGIGYELY